jgi:hypothetical protein
MELNCVGWKWDKLLKGMAMDIFVIIQERNKLESFSFHQSKETILARPFLQYCIRRNLVIINRFYKTSEKSTKISIKTRKIWLKIERNSYFARGKQLRNRIYVDSYLDYILNCRYELCLSQWHTKSKIVSSCILCNIS